MQHVCSPDHGVIVMAFCFGGILGILVCTVINDMSQRKPPS